MNYTDNIQDIELALVALGGEACAKEIQNYVLASYCGGAIPANYQN